MTALLKPLLVAAVLIEGIRWLLRPEHRKGTEAMYDCSTELTGFHDTHVRLSKGQRDVLRSHRDANRRRVRSGLAQQGRPTPAEFLGQGSYSMHTIIQQPNQDYDIDDGVVFNKEDLVGAQGANNTSLAARKMVCDAVQDDKFETPPEVRKNCVRVHYEAGHHVDIPVYRRVTPMIGEPYLQLAGPEWRKSDARAVTKWFNDAVDSKSPDSTNGRQLRRVVRLLKAFAKSRPSWNMPSGLALSVLAVDHYVPCHGRDDVAFYETARAIHNQLSWSLVVRHPVLDEDLTQSGQDAPMVVLRDRLRESLDILHVLMDGQGCDREAALKAWGKVFRHKHFDELLCENSDAATVAALKSIAVGISRPTRPYCGPSTVA